MKTPGVLGLHHLETEGHGLQRTGGGGETPHHPLLHHPEAHTGIRKLVVVTEKTCPGGAEVAAEAGKIIGPTRELNPKRGVSGRNQRGMAAGSDPRTLRIWTGTRGRRVTETPRHPPSRRPGDLRPRPRELPSRSRQKKWAEDGMTAASVRPEELLTTEETLPGVLLRLQPENPSRTKLHREDKSLPVLRRVQIQRRERRSDLE